MGGHSDGDVVLAVGNGILGQADWGPCPVPPDTCPADFDKSGTVDIVDFLTVLANWS